MKKECETKPRSKKASSKPLFYSKLCRLKDLENAPFSLSQLNEFAKTGELQTVKLGAARCVTLEAWDDFRKGIATKINTKQMESA